MPKVAKELYVSFMYILFYYATYVKHLMRG